MTEDQEHEREHEQTHAHAHAGTRRAARSLRSRALGYLSRREYSRVELARKLAPFIENEEAGALVGLLDSLEQAGWLSDARFTESVMHRRAARAGASRIINELKQHAVDDALIENAGIQLRKTELARAQAVWQKKYGQFPATQQARAKQARFLAGRGFARDVIGKILKGFDEDEYGD
jgi:regulatory protein